jgi:diacylglycerol kinase (ATP)
VSDKQDPEYPKHDPCSLVPVGMPGVDVILNRNASRLGERSALRAAILDAAARGGARVHETIGLDDLDRVARDIASRGASTVVLAGGDGSTMRGVSALARACRVLPAIALVPGGTVCTVARNLGAHGNARAWARRVIGAACGGTARVQGWPTLRVRDDTESDWVGFIFGAGLVARFFDVYYASSRQGLGTAAGIVARVFAGTFVGSRLARRVLDPTRCSLSIDGVEHKTRAWRLVVASTVRDVGLHVLVTYRGGEERDRFHVVASGLPARALGRQLVRALTGRPLTGEPHVDTLARSVSLAFEEANGGYILDGEVLRARRVTVESGPIVSVLAP